MDSESIIMLVGVLIRTSSNETYPAEYAKVEWCPRNAVVLGTWFTYSDRLRDRQRHPALDLLN
jgi:hypothetical protein